MSDSEMETILIIHAECFQHPFRCKSVKICYPKARMKELSAGDFYVKYLCGKVWFVRCQTISCMRVKSLVMKLVTTLARSVSSVSAQLWPASCVTSCADDVFHWVT